MCLEARHQGCRPYLNAQLGWSPEKCPNCALVRGRFE